MRTNAEILKAEKLKSISAFSLSLHAPCSLLLALLLLAPCSLLRATVRYVNVNNAGPVSPYTSWAAAATSIQQAIDISAAGDQILVTNGVYQTGGRTVYGSVLNRVALTRAVTVQSVNGASVTTILGYTGGAATRCAYLTNGATLVGFTLTNGLTAWDAGSSDSTAGGVWGETNSFVSDCVIINNTAEWAGGVFRATLTNCVITGNSARWPGSGGGVESCTLNHCTLVGNTCGDSGGGANASTLNDCTLTGNRATNSGAGAINSTLNRCFLTGNYAFGSGGGAYACTLNSCALSANSALATGGGAQGGALNNCTLTGNSAPTGGGADSSALTNCIVYYNRASRLENYSGSATLAFCCTAPLPVAGAGNIDAEPQLANASHLGANSPCRAAGSAQFANGTDIDGEAWATPPSIGCDEFYSGSLTGALSVAIQANYTNVAAGFRVDFVALISGLPGASRWNFGDGTVVSNRPYASHSWSAPGNYPVVLTAYNTTNPGGISATVTVQVISAPVHYVSLSSTNPLPPFLSWSTAATNIQDAVDAATVTGALVLVTNGTYQDGARTVNANLCNRVAVTKPIVVQSANGPALTVIQGNPTNGDTAVRCVYLTTGAMLSGFTLTQGATLASGDSDREQFGGGVWCESASAVVSNCVITANSANLGGGAAIGGTLYNCVLSTNVAYGEGAGADYCWLKNCVLAGNNGPDWWGGGGGGAHLSTLHTCTLAGNSGYYGGGANSCALTECTLTNNSALTDGGGANSCVLNRCTLFSNSAWSGGGAAGSTLDRCIFSANTANFGAGATGSTLHNSLLYANAAKFGGGGVDGCTLNNCTLTGNSAGSYAGGASGGTLNNCIVFYNLAPNGSNYLNTTFSNSCTLPLPPGNGNIGVEPQLADLAHLSSGSPCRGAGSAALSSGRDIDGEAWLNPPSIGCDEYVSGAATGALSVAISARFTNVVVGAGLDFVAQISGRSTASRWEFGDGTVLSNRPYASHSWAALGDFPVVLRAYNDSFPGGISATVTVHVVTQPVHYVAVSNATPVAPFTSWATAATNIQDAVDAVATAGTLVLVSNGVYAAGSRLVNNNVPHRLVVTKPVTVQSVNGPGVTAIHGQSDAGHIRCAYLASGAALVGLTLTNGQTRYIWEEPPFEDMVGGGVWCESPSALLSNCVIVACSAGSAGGGVYGGTLNNCTLMNNSTANQGGGAYLSILNHCVLLTNTAYWYGVGSGGGADTSTLNHCYLAYNGADVGGGAGASVLNNCTLSANYAGNGGAVSGCAVTNSAMTVNSAGNTGGGASVSTLLNCTLAGNSATNFGGGVANSTNFNCLVYHNFAPAGSNWTASSFDFSCTLPLPAGSGNTAVEPQLADSFHLSARSPCRGAGLAAYASGSDIDDEAWLNPPSIGCDEFRAGTITGALSAAILVGYTNVTAQYVLGFQAVIGGHASASRWDFGDGTVVSNHPYASHAWGAPGDYLVELRVFNESFPAGVSASIMVHVQEKIHYVALGNLTPTAPYLSWATAATNIQDAVDAAFVGGMIIVSNGIYQTGGRVASSVLSNRVAATRQVTLQSVNGPALTVIQGIQPNSANAIRCVSLARDSVLAGFTLANGGTRTDGDGDLDQTGGGVWCDSLAVVVSNCVITANTANGGAAGIMRGTLFNCIVSSNSPNGAANSVLNNCSVIGNTGTGAGGCVMNNCLVQGNSAYDGGGAGGCLLTNCTITANHATRYGGGSQASTMYNCLVTGNSAGSGGGGIYNDWMYNCTIVGNSSSGYGGGALIASILYNCIIYDNTAPNGPNYWSDYLAYCCTTPFYAGGPGNITNAPLFVNEAAGNLRLQANSPCINSGYNAYAPAGFDFDGNPRIVGGAVDIGAYEFQGAGSVIAYAWLAQFGLPTDGSADFADPDGDGMNNWQEWRADTVPTNSLSVLRLTTVTNAVSGLQVVWQSVATRNYFLQRGTNLSGVPPLSTIATNIPGQLGTTTYTDSTAIGSGPFFYRLGVQE